MNLILNDYPKGGAMTINDDKLYDLAELFKVFGDSTRIRILFVLFERICAFRIFQMNYQ